MKVQYLVGSLLALCTPQSQSPVHGQAPVRVREKAAYQSPYKVNFRTPVSDLIGDVERTERGDRRLESDVPYTEWYTHKGRERFGSWGPHPRLYPPPPGVESWPVEMQRERVIAVALRFLGYGYQHHHIPDWDPPQHWPWKNTCTGQNGRGFDCSNFTSFVYNLGFGLRLNSEVHHQAEEHFAKGLGSARIPIRHIELPKSYAERIAALRIGDLVFIRNNGGKISHVVIWVGPIGQSPDGTPLIIDSHGEDVHDSDGKAIPCGIQLRPFRERSWYNHSADHAIRLIRGD